MERVCVQPGIFRSLVFVLFVCIGLINSACGADMNTSLLVQQTPANGGKVSPEVGIHQMVFDSEVKIRAIALPGYQFVYWLGDVVDPTSSTTIVVLDGPKIVIAVFERVSHGFIITAEGAQSGAGGENRRIPSNLNFNNSKTNRAIARKRPHKQNVLFNDDFPVPGGLDEIGEPDDIEEIPEPATVLLMTFGTLFMTRAGKRKRELR